ncbi:MAG: MBL fold metallo-hydrolase [Deltaproteobacteria bacterium]|nr:MBL fold metallo-hydrolase [Deltaproteobacteria bacterium]
MRLFFGFALFAWALIAPMAFGQQQDFSKIDVKGSKVSGNVYMLQADLGSGNIGASVGPDGILIVDDQFAPQADKIRAALKEAGGGPLKFILNTHWHFDHVGSNKVFGPEAPIIAHTNVRKRLMTEQKIMGRTFPPEPKQAWPVITFDNALSIHFNGEEIKMFHLLPGHTDGDSVVYFTGSKVVHMGDQFIANGFPFIDYESGGDVEGFTKNVATVLVQLPPDTKVIPGHGSLSTLDDLKRYHRMLVETTASVRQRMEAGKSLDAIKAEGFPDEWKPFGGGFIKAEMWIEAIHAGLSRQKTPAK